MSNGRVIHHLLLRHAAHEPFSSPIRALTSFANTRNTLATKTPQQKPLPHISPSSLEKPTYFIHQFAYLTCRLLSTTSTQKNNGEENIREETPLQCDGEENSVEEDPLQFNGEENSTDEDIFQYETTEEGETDGWEEEEEEDGNTKVGDGGNGGGVVLQGVPWGPRVLSIAQEVLLHFGDDMKLFAFKTTPRGYIYVRLDKLSTQYGCPSIEELESYCQEYKKKLEEVGALGEIPDNLALEVSSPGAERILKVPDDLCRFKNMPMRVCYVEEESNRPEEDGIFILDSLDMESENCVWKLADVKENRDPQSKGRPLSRKRKDWRLKLPFEMHRRVTLYLEF